ncbi:MAG TPA: PH domain-containing protein [Actinotalea sp.]
MTEPVPFGDPAPTAPAPGASLLAQAGPFDPPNVRWQPVSRKLITVRLTTVAIVLVLPLLGSIALAAFGGVPGLWAIPGLVVLVGLWAVVLVPRQVRAMGYAERDDDLLIRRGVMFRNLVVVPYGRMQFVDVQQGPLNRWCGIATVQLHTASPGSDAAISGLAREEAGRLRDRLAARGEAQLAGL